MARRVAVFTDLYALLGVALALHVRTLFRRAVSQPLGTNISPPNSLEGAVTVLLAIIFGFILPSSPASVPGLTLVEKELLLWRIKTEQGAADKKDEISAMHGFTLALIDPKAWCFLGILSSTYVAASVTQFFPT